MEDQSYHQKAEPDTVSQETQENTQVWLPICWASTFLFVHRPLNPRSGRIIAVVKKCSQRIRTMIIPRLFILRTHCKERDGKLFQWLIQGGVWGVQTTLKKSVRTEQFLKVLRYLPRNWNKPPKRARSFAKKKKEDLRSMCHSWTKAFYHLSQGTTVSNHGLHFFAYNDKTDNVGLRGRNRCVTRHERIGIIGFSRVHKVDPR